MQNLIILSSLILLCLSACQEPEPIVIEPGVSASLASYRKATYADIQYDITLGIPSTKSERIAGVITIGFNHLQKPTQDLVLDFNVTPALSEEIKFNTPDTPFRWENEHLIIDQSALEQGWNEFTLKFVAGEVSLNRNEDYLYTLFVPDRASTAFPCFDQPDLKARFTLALTIPDNWVAVTNYSLKNESAANGKKILEYNPTDPLPTYLFAFAAGDFKVAVSDSTTRPMTMYYRETDSLKVAQNQQEIFRLHHQSIDWMEEYTAIDYPFDKFDFALLPPFQYGGMEHPGSIFYRERSLFLDEAATLNDRLGRASLIAHETAHIWFGDLVTMKWFNDVWSKEVFANFMADKMVNPSFQEINHDLKFLLRHFPGAYAVDRTKGANAIRQDLGNLKNAGLMYGSIIYNKAPVMMKHLEQLTGEEAFRDGMRVYLSRFSYANADWNDLIGILDEKTDTDLKQWSSQWIEEPGMPVYSLSVNGDEVALVQQDPLERGRTWMQQLTILTDKGKAPVYFESTNSVLNSPSDFKYALINGQGMEYGGFLLDDRSVAYFLEHTYDFEDEFVRGRILLDLHETFLAARMDPDIYFRFLFQSIQAETDDQLLSRLLNQLRDVYWKFLTQEDRKAFEIPLESTLMDLIDQREDLSMKMAYYRTLVDIFQSNTTWNRLFKAWKNRSGFMGIPLSSRDYTALAMQLVLRTEDRESYQLLMDGEWSHLTNPDDKERLLFIRSSLDPDPVTRTAFFDSLKDPVQREHEPWVLTALGFLHHPLRQETSIAYIQPGLEMISEIQLTGDIFFPGRWLDVMLNGHQSQKALDDVHDFMKSKEAQVLNDKLKLKIWVAADELERSVSMNKSIRDDQL